MRKTLGLVIAAMLTLTHGALLVDAARLPIRAGLDLKTFEGFTFGVTSIAEVRAHLANNPPPGEIYDNLGAISYPGASFLGRPAEAVLFFDRSNRLQIGLYNLDISSILSSSVAPYEQKFQAVIYELTQLLGRTPDLIMPVWRNQYSSFQREPALGVMYRDATLRAVWRLEKATILVIFERTTENEYGIMYGIYTGDAAEYAWNSFFDPYF